jgi:glutathione S-transferase
MLTVWGRTNSVNVQKVMWCIGELGLSYERIEAGLEHGRNREDWYLALNPNGRVPLLQDGAFSLWESNTIVRYLCAKHGRAPLYPATHEQRAHAERWMDWQLSTIARPSGIAFWNLVRIPPAERNPEAVARAVAETNAAFDILDVHLAERPFVAGDALTIGDIPVGALAHRWLALDGIDRPVWPALRRWFERLAERPAFREHVMLPLS